jgi:ferredoxin-NADP reductase
MQELKASFLEKISRTPTVSSFRFSLPQKIDFIPGQFLQVIFDEEQRDNKELNKYLSFSCAPGRGYIEVTKRLSASLFSQRLIALKGGGKVLIRAPLGSCVFEDSYSKVAFLIGGIGITPVISIIEYIAAKKLPTDVHLVYANRSEEETAFKRELDLWQEEKGNIKVSYVVSDSPPKDKNFIFGRIDAELIKDVMPDIAGRMLFIFGPPKMVEVMHQLALELGCAKENIKRENFIGY